MSVKRAGFLNRGARGLPGVRVALHRSVLDRAHREILDNPQIEVGGKFVGYLSARLPKEGPVSPDDLAKVRLEIVAYLDAGPRADRSATHHYSDTDYQHALFEAVERRHPGLRFLGIWHSHHPNGLATLSEGDAETGVRTVDSPNHETGLLLSSLAIDRRGLAKGKNFLFLRGDQDFYELPPESMVIFEGANPVAEAVREEAERLHRRHREGVPAAGTRTPSLPPWVSTPAGRAMLAEDQAWLGEYPGLKSFHSGGLLVWRGEVERGEQTFTCAYAYAEGGPEGVPRAVVSGAAGGVSISASAELGVARTRAEEFSFLVDGVAHLGRQLSVLRRGAGGG